MRSDLAETILEARKLRAELRSHLAVRKAISTDLQRLCVGTGEVLLLTMAEGLIAAHKAAKIDGNGSTLDLIEDALGHVGERLAKESGHGRDFSRKRLAPHR